MISILHQTSQFGDRFKKSWIQDKNEQNNVLSLSHRTLSICASEQIIEGVNQVIYLVASIEAEGVEDLIVLLSFAPEWTNINKISLFVRENEAPHNFKSCSGFSSLQPRIRLCCFVQNLKMKIPQH